VSNLKLLMRLQFVQVGCEPILPSVDEEARGAFANHKAVGATEGSARRVAALYVDNKFF
jgi:hypothetical protein